MLLRLELLPYILEVCVCTFSPTTTCAYQDFCVVILSQTQRLFNTVIRCYMFRFNESSSGIENTEIQKIESTFAMGIFDFVKFHCFTGIY